ncbi:DUF4232 domain-containing protein [Streptacidiphilus jiangxiensis]|uniref:DUF4232 domain-containing protein n=1 Tax=Streptacidiphilus jiangxiensis TaxID=235985 RepID=A0A1H7QM15_STRJI|nr:DUF4232 domain-containing protein [Streptacidiphilus jiangxiensis]SEL49130.1 Protein of unknown function [Streptacidiphilus jiangxiensis]
MTGSADPFDPTGGPAGEPGDPFEELRHTPVTPLPIPEGAFAQARQRAARRRRRRAAFGATAGVGALAVAVYLTGAFVPRGPSQVVTPPASAGHSFGTPRPLPSTAAPTAVPSVSAFPSAAAPSPSATAPSASASASASPTTSGTPLCTAAQLTPRLGSGNAGAGQIYTYLVVTNHSSTPCHVAGYPGLSLLDASGHQIGVPATYEHQFPSTPVVLAPGASASDTIHTVNRQTNNPSECLPTSTLLRIYPPGSFTSLTFPGRITVCLGTFELTPFGPGTTGNPAN